MLARKTKPGYQINMNADANEAEARAIYLMNRRAGVDLYRATVFALWPSDEFWVPDESIVELRMRLVRTNDAERARYIARSIGVKTARLELNDV